MIVPYKKPFPKRVIVALVILIPVGVSLLVFAKFIMKKQDTSTATSTENRVRAIGNIFDFLGTSHGQQSSSVSFGQLDRFRKNEVPPIPVPTPTRIPIYQPLLNIARSILRLPTPPPAGGPTPTPFVPALADSSNSSSGQEGSFQDSTLPTPTDMPELSSTDTLVPSPTVSPTLPPSGQTLLPTSTPTPTPFVVPTSVPTGTPTPLPTSTPTPTPTPLPGDANLDGIVDELDYAIWLSHYGQSVTDGAASGDFNSDGTVDGVDYASWLLHASL